MGPRIGQVSPAGVRQLSAKEIRDKGIRDLINASRRPGSKTGVLNKEQATKLYDFYTKSAADKIANRGYVAERKAELLARKGELKGKIFGQSGNVIDHTNGKYLPAVRYNNPTFPNQQQLELNRMSRATVKSDFDRALNNIIEDSKKAGKLKELEASKTAATTNTSVKPTTTSVGTYGQKLTASEVASKKAELYKNLGEYRNANGQGTNKVFGGAVADSKAAETIAKNNANLKPEISTTAKPREALTWAKYRAEHGLPPVEQKVSGVVEADRIAADKISLKAKKAGVNEAGAVVDNTAAGKRIRTVKPHSWVQGEAGAVADNAAGTATKTSKGFFSRIGQGIKNIFKGGAATEGASKGVTGGFLKGASKLAKFALKGGGLLALAFEVPALVKAYKNGDFGKQCVRSGLSVLGSLAAGALCLAGGPVGVLIGGTMGYLIGKGLGEAIVGKSIEDQKADGTYKDPSAKPSFTGKDKAAAGAAGAAGENEANSTDSTDGANKTKVVGDSNSTTTNPTKTSGEYTIVKGDCIWNIVKKEYPELKTNAEILKKTKEIIKLNHLDTQEHKFGDLIFPKQGLSLAA